jgi:hypothetical protein
MFILFLAMAELKKLAAVIAIFLFTIANECVAQSKTITQEGQFWLGYFNQSRFSKKWGSWFDIHLRTKEQVFNNFSQFLVRAGATYYVSDKFRITAGYVYAHYFPAEGHKEIGYPEHRFWQQVQWQSNFSRLRIIQAVRLEQRFRHKILNDKELAPGYNFNYRIRYNTVLNIPVNKPDWRKNTIAFIMSDEIFVNFGKEIIYNHFDQNRFFAGLSWYINPTDHLQLGYMNLFQQSASGNKYKSLNILRLYFIQQIDWRKSRGNGAEAN